MLDPYKTVGYTYKGRDFNPGALVEYLIAEEHLSEGARFSPPELVLDTMAQHLGIDREDERSLDPNVFPKPIHEDQVGVWDETWLNGIPMSYRPALAVVPSGFGLDL